ncbi:MAG: hypothetical protein ACOCP8_08455, partial [archaeon]
MQKYIKKGIVIIKKAKKIIKKVINKKRNKKNIKKILVVGGYGYNNVGDEAQLNATLKVLKNEMNDYMIRVLTPNEYYTHNYHDKCLVGEAPRIAFYGQDRSFLYDWLDKIRVFKLVFLIKSFWIYFNAFLVKYNLPTFFLNARRASLLYEIKNTSAVYFCGGGYLTGRTLSRL